MNTIRCIHCGKEIEISEALSHELKASYEADYRKKLEQAQREAEEKALKKASEELELKMKDKENEAVEAKERAKKLQEELLETTRMIRELKEKDEQRELEMEKKLQEHLEKIKEDTLKQYSNEFRLKEMEKDKQIDDLKKLLDEAQRKADQKSQQMQGEVQELDLEETLRSEFSDDEIVAVGKGVNGADIRQIVKTKRGNICGEILWESKRTKAWGGDWVDKLKVDIRAQKASAGIIVSSVLPKEMKTTFGFWEGVYVTTYDCYLPLVEVLRQKLIEIAYQKFVSQNRGEKADVLYEYVTGIEFRQQVEAIAEVYQEQLEQITKERASFERIWKSRESQAKRLLLATTGMYGSMQGIVGGTMPQIKAFEIAELDDGK